VKAFSIEPAFATNPQATLRWGTTLTDGRFKAEPDRLAAIPLLKLTLVIESFDAFLPAQFHPNKFVWIFAKLSSLSSSALGVAPAIG
jgi:hypothetical protein